MFDNKVISLLALVFILSCSFKYGFVQAEETCTWKEDGSQVCENDEGESHNVWTDPDHEENLEKKENIAKLLTSQRFNELELEIFVKFFAQLKEWNPTMETLTKFDPEVLALAAIKVFNEFDDNDDGFLDNPEIKADVGSQENLAKIEGIVKGSAEEKISVFQYLESFFKLGDGEITIPLFSPFLRLKNLPAGVAKKIIQGSIQMFIESDEDKNGKLDQDEFFTGMKKSKQKLESENADTEATVPDEQLQGLFDLVDKDDDDLLTYSEFQATIPEPPKSLEDSMKEIFNAADEDGDGLVSETEFRGHMQKRAKEINVQIPTDSEVTDIFAKLDHDGDEHLDPEEMYALFKDARAIKHKQMMEAFTSFDKDADGEISLDELEEIAKGMSQNSGQKIDTKLFFSMLDKNKDARVSLEELEEMLASSMK